MNPTIGQPLKRVDGWLKVTGSARYAAEFALPKLVHAALIQSPIAKGRLTTLDLAAAKAAPGVIDILTRANGPHFPPYPADLTKPGSPGENRVPLQDDELHWVGQHVGVVIAESLDDARYAVSLVRPDCAAAAPLLTLDDPAAQKNATMPEKWVGTEELQVARGEVAAALAFAPNEYRLEVIYTTPIENHNPIEAYSTTAHWTAPDQLLLHDATRGIKQLQKVVANAFQLPLENVRIVSPFVGGAFGSKGFQWSHTLLAAAAARLVRRAVKLTFTRAQMFDSAGQRAETVQQFAVAAGNDGKLTALHHQTTTHCSPVAEYPEPCGNMSRMLYACPAVEVSHRLVHLNYTTPCPMRAPGEAPGVFALECVVDELAHQLRIDPLQFRLTNYAEEDEFEKKPWSGKRLRECYARGAEKFGWAKRQPAPRSMPAPDGSLLGWGMATAIYPAKQQPAAAHAILSADALLTIRSATHEIGTGTYTTMSQLAAHALGLSLENVHFELGDSQFPQAPVNGGSWLTASVGSAVLAVCAELKKKVVELAGSWPNDIAGLKDALARSDQPQIEAGAKAEPDKEEREKFSFHSFGALFVEVRVDSLGQVRVTRATGVYDVGRILNPRLARSQIYGGIIFGLGMALMEATIPDLQTGRIVNANLAEYHVPVCADIPEFDIDFLDEPDPHMPDLGARGIGEIGIVGAPAAIANAIFHATGKRVRDLPITPDKLI
ncbi:MAG: xanthine dehydrogenase family protein molybdopterin-binding subunit [Chthoniobacterales bacterium]|nr:xanthine dehydrogenase family protein molybdopterin-binding subunit [Chthoniobacterales bacterium]